MAIIHNNGELGMFPNGSFQHKGRRGKFSAYSVRQGAGLNGGSCGLMGDTNKYGSGWYGGFRTPIDPANKAYQFSASVKTIEKSYNSRNGSGHMGIRMYDKWNNVVYGYMSPRYGQTTLSRAITPGDTEIYIVSGSGWSTSSSTSNTRVTFNPPTHPDYSTAWDYTRLTRTYTGSTLTNLGGGEWKVTLTAAVPDWGYALPIGTPVANSRGTNSNTYCITGNSDYGFGIWKTYTSGVMSGYMNTGGSFRCGTVSVAFLNLRNYKYRSEKSGNCAKYLIDNIMMVECPGGVARPSEIFKRRGRRR
jgi:hypothetical protein